MRADEYAYPTVRRRPVLIGMSIASGWRNLDIRPTDRSDFGRIR